MRNRANTYVRTGRSYGGILRNSRNESQNAYNDAYYETGTTFDRVGNRLNRTNLYNDQSRTRDPRYNRHGYNQQAYDQQRYNQQRYSDPEIDRRYASNGYTDPEMAEARRTEKVEKIEYNSTTLSGTYHNLDNPQVDVRDFPEGVKMKNRIVAALVLSMIFAGTSVAAYNTQNVVDAQVIENDLHPSDGTPTLFKVKTPVYSNKKLTGKPRAYIKKGTVVRAQSKSSMIYNGILVYFDSKNTIQGDNLTKYASKHATEFDKLISTNKSTKLYSSKTYKPCATVSEDTSFLITDEDSDFYTVSYDDHSALIYKKDADEQIYVKVISYNNVKESLNKIYADLQKLADSMNLGSLDTSINVSSEVGSEIVEYAKQFVGNPYVWGGTSLTDGCDCSGFVQQIYAHYGITLPRCSADQSLTGTQVSVNELQPGDLLYFYRGSRIGHVEMYAGNGMVVHAKGSKYGIVYEQLHEKPAVCRRYLEENKIEK